MSTVSPFSKAISASLMIIGGLLVGATLDPPTSLASAPAPVKANGTHTCYKSDRTFGHTCEVSGEGYSDCIIAQAALAANDCCPRTKEGGHSYHFAMDTCGPQ